MNDQKVLLAIQQMEIWMADPNWDPDPEVLIQWNKDFQGVLAGAGRGDGWPDLVARAHILGARVEVRVAQLMHLRDGMKAELDAQDCGDRALRGYGASAR